ncbi:dockerin type I repeat-containing protein [Posidoniimonas polymericola]|uniref:dockerin type I repeat-containing protein n=1 Tax=Posidoniimonas polymericola TaxID=2528002 RepID=UPI0011B85EBE|nr:dockerin type I repeat-containing protein [Posidoniimonas polymericola]
MAALALIFIGGQASAVVLFSDTFDRSDNRNIDAELTGITNNTGTTLGVDGVYSQPFLDPANDPGPQDGDATNGGGAQILNSNLQLAVGAGTSNAYVNHNFTNSDILTAGAFSVSLDVLDGYGGTSAGQGAAFGIGMTQADADTAGDANGAGSGGPTFSDAFNPDSTPVGDFWVGIRGDSTIAWGDGDSIQSAPVGNKFGTVSANFGVSDFSAGSVVTYEVFFDGVNVGVGSFQWSNDNANFIGLDGRTGNALSLDNFTVETSTPPVVPSLTIDRATGNITLTNETAQPLSMIVYSITSQNGGFDRDAWATIESQGIDADDDWITLTDTTGPVLTDISEGTVGSYALGASGSANDSINFGDAWIPGPAEDVQLELRDVNGNDVPVVVQYVGDPIQAGDYNGNGTIDAGDWPTIRDNLVSDVSSLTPFEAYLSGDLTGDGVVDRADFRQFKGLWEAANPGMSFAAMVAAPEPTSIALLALGLLAAPCAARRRGAAVVALVLGLSLSATSAQAVTLFADTFDRADSRNIDAELTGVANNTGTTLGVGGVYSQPFVDPANDPGPQDGDAVNGGGTQILGGQLQLAVGAGTSNAYVNHNFVNNQILADGGFRVTLGVLGYGGGTRGQGGGFAIGMSQARADSAGDAAGGDDVMMTAAFNDLGFIGNTLPAPENVVSDFWVAIRGNNSLAWGGGNGPIYGAAEGALAAKTGVVSATFAPTGFNAGDAVAYEVFVDDVSMGYGAFQWSEDQSNYIGIDGRDGGAVIFDNFAVETVTDAAINPLRLQVDTATGSVSIAGGDVANELDYYEIRSATGGLVAGAFTGLAGAAGFPAGDGSGNGWEQGGVQTSGLLNESYLQASSTVSAGAAATSLGAVYDTTADSRDLQFFYDLPDGSTVPGFVEYLSLTSLPDFNGDGTVDAADYTVWRDNEGTIGGAAFADGDANGDGNVTAADYSIWKANYGATVLVAPSGTVSAPEPSAVLLTFGLLPLLRRRRNGLSK